MQERDKACLKCHTCHTQDGLVLNHWQRLTDEGKEYPFAKFNKSLDIPTYTEEDYTVSDSR